jgi:hypothetical protein
VGGGAPRLGQATLAAGARLRTHHGRRRNWRGEGGAAGIIDRGSVRAEVAGAGRSYDGARGAGVGDCGSFFISRDRSVGTCEVRRGIAGNDGRPSDASDVHLVALLNF